MAAWTIAGTNRHPQEGDGPDAQFIKRFELDSYRALGTDAGIAKMRDVLVRGIRLAGVPFIELLATEIDERIESVIGNLGDLNNIDSDEAIDERLCYGQFWREVGAEIANDCARRQEAWQPALDAAFREWKLNPGAKYTVPRLRNLQRRGRGIRGVKSPIKALELYWGIQKRFVELEDDVIKAVVEFDIENG
jgi:hypothetical protein